MAKEWESDTYPGEWPADEYDVPVEDEASTLDYGNLEEFEDEDYEY